MGNLCATPAKEAGRGAPEVRVAAVSKENVSSKKEVSLDKERKDTNKDSASNGSMDDYNVARERDSTYANKDGAMLA